MEKNRGFSPGPQGEAKASLPRYSHLSHLDIENHYQFITFRTQDSVDGYLKKLAQQNLPNGKRQLAITATKLNALYRPFNCEIQVKISWNEKVRCGQGGFNGEKE